MEEMRNAYKIFVAKPEGKRPLRRPSIWEDMNGSWGNSVEMCGMDASGSG